MSTSKTQLQVATAAEDLTAASNARSKVTCIDKKILERLQKCLAKAEYPDASEAEAQTAMLLSSKIMDQHNLNRSDLIAAEAESGEPSSITGDAAVYISHPNKEKNVISETWVVEVVKVMELMFNCKSYSTCGIGIDRFCT